jgi:sulfur-oxidizing protein SoxX
MLRRIAPIFAVVLLWPVGILGSAAIAAGPPGGLVLPPGDAAAGRLVFLKMQCNHCHMVTGKLSEGIALPVAATPAPLLGPEVAKKSQAELVTSIVNPSHVIQRRAPNQEGKLSPMGDYTHVLTVRQLIDLVAFLESAGESSAAKK